MDYDQRRRDRRIETDRQFAIAETRRIHLACEGIAPSAIHLPINVRGKVSYDAEGSPAIPSTVGREVMYSVAHAIHHYALLGIMCGLMGIRLPPGFGVAPSTLEYQEAGRALAAS